MRDDFYSRFARETGQLVRWLEQGLSNVPLYLEQEDVRAIVEEPARAVGRELTRVSRERSVLDVAFSPEGHSLATTSNDSTAALVKTAIGRELALIHHKGPARAIAFSPDGHSS